MEEEEAEEEELQLESRFTVILISKILCALR